MFGIRNNGEERSCSIECGFRMTPDGPSSSPYINQIRRGGSTGNRGGEQPPRLSSALRESTQDTVEVLRRVLPTITACPLWGKPSSSDIVPTRRPGPSRRCRDGRCAAWAQGSPPKRKRSKRTNNVPSHVHRPLRAGKRVMSTPVYWAATAAWEATLLTRVLWRADRPRSRV